MFDFGQKFIDGTRNLNAGAGQSINVPGYNCIIRSVTPDVFPSAIAGTYYLNINPFQAGTAGRPLILIAGWWTMSYLCPVADFVNNMPQRLYPLLGQQNTILAGLLTGTGFLETTSFATVMTAQGAMQYESFKLTNPLTFTDGDGCGLQIVTMDTVTPVNITTTLNYFGMFHFLQKKPS